MRRIVLTGFRGTGKTDIGRMLAEKTAVPFIDSDAIIERMNGRSIPAIFAQDGEAKFRSLERKAIASLPTFNAIVSTGGGAVLDPANMELLRRDSTMILLTADPVIIEQRIRNSPRPALTGLTLHDEIEDLMSRRRETYRASADLCVDTSSTTPAVAADRIIGLLSRGIPKDRRDRASAFFRAAKIPAPARDRVTGILAPDSGSRTQIMGVAGNPCTHSRGPALFNELFRRYGLDYHYTFFEHPDIGEIVKIARGIGSKGLSVTIPFKSPVMEQLDTIDERARQIGAVNTVVFACGELVGYNTDWIGVRKPLEGMKGAKAVLLGAGGVAAAAAYALMDLSMDLTILNRTEEKARDLAERFGCHWAPWDSFDSIAPELVVNATSLGMHPDTRSPLREDQLRPGMTVFDLVYTPPVTPLLAAAKRRDCHVISGTGMFAEQAREQFRLFFGIDVPTETIREILA